MSNLDFHPKRPLVKDVDVGTLLQMFRDGMTIGDISLRTGVSPITIRNYLHGYKQEHGSYDEPKNVIHSVELTNASKVIPVEEPIENVFKPSAQENDSSLLEGFKTMAVQQRHRSTKASIEEMKRWREKGLDNADIAVLMNVSAQTVDNNIGRRYAGMVMSEVIKRNNEYMAKRDELLKTLGLEIPRVSIKQQKNHKKQNVSATKTDANIAEVKATDIIATIDKAEAPTLEQNCLKTVSASMQIDGSLCRYEIDAKEHIMEMKQGSINGILDKSGLDALIGELQEIRQRYI